MRKSAQDLCYGITRWPRKIKSISTRTTESAPRRTGRQTNRSCRVDRNWYLDQYEQSLVASKIGKVPENTELLSKVETFFEEIVIALVRLALRSVLEFRLVRYNRCGRSWCAPYLVSQPSRIHKTYSFQKSLIFTEEMIRLLSPGKR
jgi:hypothetical protein